MTISIFDLAKNLKTVPNTITVSDATWNRIKDSTKPADENDGYDSMIDIISGMRVEVIDDALERKVRAAALSMQTGAPVICEGEDGFLYLIEMPKFDPIGS